MSTSELAHRLVDLCRKGDYQTVYEELFHPDVISQEPEATEWGTVQGLEAIIEKGKKWEEMVEEMHGIEISDPIVAENYFSLSMSYDATFKEGGRQQFNEICVYETNDGKVVKEQFFYTVQEN